MYLINIYTYLYLYLYIYLHHIRRSAMPPTPHHARGGPATSPLPPLHSTPSLNARSTLFQGYLSHPILLPTPLPTHPSSHPHLNTTLPHTPLPHTPLPHTPIPTRLFPHTPPHTPIPTHSRTRV